MRVPPRVSMGKGGLLILAVAALPIALRKFKPAAKRVGEKMVEWGEKLQRDTEKNSNSSSNVDMESSKASEHIKSSSPTGKEEVKEQVASRQARTAKPPVTKSAKVDKAEPKAKPGKATNPKKPTKGAG